MIIAITPVYAALFALFFVALSLRVVNLRRSARINLGDGGNQEMTRRIRVHGNFIEYVPLTLILMALAELQGQPAWAVHLIGACLVIGRVAHAYGVGKTPQIMPLRVLGMVLTFTALTIGAITNLVASLAG